LHPVLLVVSPSDRAERSGPGAPCRRGTTERAARSSPGRRHPGATAPPAFDRPAGGLTGRPCGPVVVAVPVEVVDQHGRSLRSGPRSRRRPSSRYGPGGPVSRAVEQLGNRTACAGSGAVRAHLRSPPASAGRRGSGGPVSGSGVLV